MTNKTTYLRTHLWMLSIAIAFALGELHAPVFSQTDTQNSPAFSGPSSGFIEADLLGVWEAEQEFGPTQSFSLGLTKLKGEKDWTAKIGHENIAFAASNNVVSFSTKNGTFRGHFESSTRQLRGHWIQPITENLNFPVATPVEFSKDNDTWNAEVSPMRDRVRFYLSISKPAGKPAEAFIRNPERNLGIRLGYLTVNQNGNKLNFQQMRGDQILSGEIVREQNSVRIVLEHPYFDEPFEFRPAERTHDSGFYPHASNSPYAYSPPVSMNDGWECSAAQDQGVDQLLMEKMVQSIRDTKTNSLEAPYIHSVLVARNGKLILEEYFYGYSLDHCHDTRSAGKSIASMLVGTVTDRDENLDENSTLTSVFGERFHEPTKRGGRTDSKLAEWRKRITIGHALAMQTGLDINDDNEESVGNEGTMQDDALVKDWVEYGLKIPTIGQPGGKSVYGSNSINLAASAIAESSQEWLPNIFAENIARPLEIKHYHFNLDPSGNGYMGGGIRLTARDQLKLGQMMLDGGVWNSRRVISESWVQKSITPHGSIHEPNDYAFGFWLKTLKLGDRSIDVFHASGNGGQLIVCVPEFDMVIQMSGGNYSHFPVWYRNLTDLIPQKILIAVANEQDK